MKYSLASFFPLKANPDSDDDNEDEENDEEAVEESALTEEAVEDSQVNRGALRGALNAITKTINRLPTHITNRKKVVSRSERMKQKSISPPMHPPVMSSSPEYSAASSGLNPMNGSANNNPYHYPPNTTVHHPQSSPPMPAESISPQYPLHSPTDYKSNPLNNPDAFKPVQNSFQWDAEKSPPPSQMNIPLKFSPPSNATPPPFPVSASTLEVSLNIS